MQEENTKNNTKSESALREERILEFWRENKTFEKTLTNSEGRKEFIFYEGPPTANGKPGIHHLEARAFKDVIPRYKTMRGYHVRRKGGWDTHGLPVELQVEKKLGLNSKKAIEEYGIAKFNQECKESVWEYLDVWNKFTKRIGYWVDQENPYVTYHNDFIESVWNVVKKVNEQELLYKDYKVVPWCPRCGTALSSHELAQGYEDVKDLSVYIKFKLKNQENTYILAWTTTPWTLPGNVALAVGKDIDYVKVKINNEFLILARNRLSVLDLPVDKHEFIEDIKGFGLIGLEYEPLFPYLSETISGKEKEKIVNAYKVYAADFVTTEDGTGVVHTAVMYGQDDFVLGSAVGLPKHHLVNLEGKFIKGTGFLEGRFVKEVDENDKPTLAVDIIKYLTDKNLFFKKENYEHSYPHCWRCHTPLIYYARDSWYVRVSDPKIKDKMIAENKEINWEPSHIRDGRFGEWLREIKDWAISRERYWGTPLPVWICESCKKIDVIGGIEDLKNQTKKSGNKYFVVRHGEAMSNVKAVLSSKLDERNKLTEKGIQDVKENAKKHINEKFDYIFTSPLARTKETAFLIAETLGLDKSKIVFDDRLLELQVGDLDGKSIEEYTKYTKSVSNYFETAFPNGESRLDVHKRMGDFIYDLENKYSNKKILIISHGDPILALYSVVDGYTKEKVRTSENVFQYFKTGEMRDLPFVPLPHNANYELDLHKPYIDEVKLSCECGGNLIRTKEVMDVWFDSGAMPFAQDHYPFENKKWVDGVGYPADFISEAIDQTRGWFYTLHAVGVLMGRGKSYKNVICLGHLLDAVGKKMSKSVGNVVDPWEAMDKYGVDTLRLWMYSVNQPGESKNFDEKTVALLSQQVFGLLYNVLAFYELYRDKETEINQKPESKNILDIWILARLNELVELMTNNLDSYKLLEPVRGMREFIGDLSTWYLRRSRERIKEEAANPANEDGARQTLYFILKTFAKVLAPFAPFSAEDIWLRLKNEGDVESVHLTEWPKESFKDVLFDKITGKSKVLENMQKVRNIVSLGLESRQKAGIKVRQPLSLLKVKNYELEAEYTELIKDELNVKEVSSDESLETEVFLDLEMTEELKQEGDYRELVRALQDMRKNMGLTPSDVVSLTLETNEAGKNLIQKFENDLKKTVLVSNIEFKENDGQEIKIDSLMFKVKINKI